MNLVVLDAYSIICTGGYLRNNVRTFQRMPVAGLSYFMGYVARELGAMKEVVVCFDFKGEKHFGTNRQRRTELTGYKSNRSIDNSVLAQCRLAYELCEMAGIRCFKTPTMEADSVVYNVVNLCRRSQQYSGIEVHSGDYDLVHNVLYDVGTRTNVFFVGVNSNVNNISHMNFMTGIYPGVRILPNTISAYKTFTFDRSDRIKAFPRGQQLYAEFVNTIQGFAEKGNDAFLDPLRNRDKNFFLTYCKGLVGDSIGEEEYRLLERRANTIFPKEFSQYPSLAGLTAETFMGCHIRKINRGTFASILKACDSPVRPADMLKEFSNPIEGKVVEAFKQAANDLISGRFSAVTPRPMTSSNLQCEDLDVGARSVVE